MALLKIPRWSLLGCIPFDRTPTGSLIPVCRLLLISSPRDFDPNPLLQEFRGVCRNSREYQGHGWGCAWLNPDQSWGLYHDIAPVWEDPKNDIPNTRLFLAHARSAFRDEGIVVENNMPFSDGTSVFLFNGELRGVKIKADGRIGAEKIYNYIRRFDHGDLAAAARKATTIIAKRTRYIRAMNFFLAQPDRIQVCSWFGEDPDYFQMRSTVSGSTHIICSEPLPRISSSWDRMPNHSVQTISL